MICPTSATTTVIHNHWLESALFENTQLDDTLELQDQLKCLTETLHDNLVELLALEQLFGEQNDKTMYIAPFIRSVIHTAVKGFEIRHVSSYPAAIDPCLVGDPLLSLLPRHGYATDIVCANTPAPVTHVEDGEGTNSEGSSSDDEENALDEAPDYDMESVIEEEATSESDRTTRRWLAGHYMTKKPEDQGTSTDFYHNQDSSTSSDHPPAALDYSLLARLTIDSSSGLTPLALICVSKAQDLYSAMTSCLHQRLAWGIHEPLAGIALDDKTCSVQVLFGWLQNSDSDCSTVHISDSAKGCYDLSDDSNAVDFASFLSRLCRHFPRVYEMAMAFTPQLEDAIAQCRLTPWRVDQLVLATDVVPEEGPSLTDQITRWLDGVDPFPSVHDQPGSCTACLTDSSSKMAGSDVMSPMETKLPSSVASNSELRHHHRISATELAAGGKHEDKTLLMSFWMLARKVIPRTLMFPPMLLDEKYKLDRSFRTIQQEYFDLVSFSWIDNLQLVEIAQAAANKLTLQTPLYVDRWLPYRALSAPCEELLCDNLWELASVLEDVQWLTANSKLQANVECRNHLDRLMTRFFHGHSNGSTAKLARYEYSNTAHVMVSLESNLTLPTGSLIEAYSTIEAKHGPFFMRSVQLRFQELLASDLFNLHTFGESLSPETSVIVEPHARNNPDPMAMSNPYDGALRTFSEDVDAVQDSANRAISHHNLERLGVINVGKDKENPMLQPYNEEPLKAVCDSVGYVRIPGVFTSIPASSSFNIIQPRHASPSPSKSVAQQSTPSDLGGFKGTNLARRQQMGREFEMDEEPVLLHVEDDAGKESTELDACKDLFLPILSSEHKKVLEGFFATNVNRARMHATASVKLG